MDNFTVKYCNKVFNDEFTEYLPINDTDKIYKNISSIISHASNPFVSKMKLYSMALANTNDNVNNRHYTYLIGTIFGGLNGDGKWINYLKEIQLMFEDLNREYNVWLIELDNDCTDDVFTLHFGIKFRD